MTEITVTLDACNADDLMRGPTERKVWIRRIDGDSYWPQIEIRGESSEVWHYIDLHWSKDEADYYVYGDGPLT